MIPRTPPRVTPAWCGVLLLWAALTCGCQTAGYYSQAIHGQCQIIARQKTISKILAAPDTPPPLREKLELVLKLRDFAEHDLKLPTDGHYVRYADLQRRYVVWNVHAAPEFSLESKAWWYPIVGRLKYRGYFSETNAQHYGEGLRTAGFDVYVDGVEAYSTLGWFRDPVLNTFINHEEADLAEILFHELAHHRVFISGDTDFNEAFATAVAAEGVRRWLRSTGNAGASEKYEEELKREREFSQLVMGARRRLEAIYSQSGTNSPLRDQKQAVLDQLRRDYQTLKARWGGYTGYDHWFAKPINNAQLNTVATYFELVPAFDRLLAAQGGELDKFYAAVNELRRLSKEERRRRLGN